MVSSMVSWTVPMTLSPMAADGVSPSPGLDPDDVAAAGSRMISELDVLR